MFIEQTNPIYGLFQDSGSKIEWLVENKPEIWLFKPNKYLDLEDFKFFCIDNL